jgi:methyl-accepting chemotaxis protein
VAGHFGPAMLVTFIISAGIFKTGLVEAYLEDFQNASLKSIRQSYYKHPGQRIYPFILDTDGIIVMHPLLARGDKSVVGSDIVRNLLADKQGGFGYTYLGEKKWCYFKHFTEWNWVIGYTMPLDIKYSDVREFHNALFVIMSGITFVVLLILSLFVRRFTQPISRLTNAAVAMAGGNLDQDVELGGNDEVGILARSFNNMRDSIRQTISELKKEAPRYFEWVMVANR